MKRFLINVDTAWPETNATFRAEAEDFNELHEIASRLAYKNFKSHGLEDEVAYENGYNPEEMTDEDWFELWKQIDESDYYYNIEEFQGDENEWDSYGGKIYTKVINYERRIRR